jgi:uncharacterized protein (TIGR02145 family)
MKTKIITLLIIGIFIITNQLFAANTNPVVSNVAFSIAGTTVTVTYDVADAEENSFTIYMEVSADNGITWDFNYGIATGHIGASVAEGTGRTITWTYSGENNSNFKIKILADDLYGDQIYHARQIYNTVTIGTQTWLKENLNIGTKINSTAAGFQQTDNSIIEKYCYNNDEANCVTYGGLYEWTEAMQYVTTEGTQGICPSGWHLPTYSEMETLDNYVGDEAAKLVAVGQPATAYIPNNETGFSALFAGNRKDYSGGFGSLGGSTYFWSSTDDGYDSYAYCVDLGSNYAAVGLDFSHKSYGSSVRCSKN